MLITFEGVDGSGKTTHFKRLTEFLIERGVKVKTFREPGGTPFGEKIRELLLDTECPITDLSELLLFETARSELITQQIKPALEEGYWVLLDRFFDSTMAYQGYGRGIPIEVVDYLNRLVAQGIKPDITFYMRIPLETSLERVGKKSKDRIENAAQSFFEGVMQGFEKIAKKRKQRVITIDGMKPKDQVFDSIIKHLMDNGYLN
jgi:dTMP kinase